MRIKIGRISCPDWIDRPLKIFIPVAYFFFVVLLSVVYSPWWLLLYLLFPSLKKTELIAEEKQKRFEDWKRKHDKEKEGAKNARPD